MAALARKQRGTHLTHAAQAKAESRVRRDFGSLRIYTVEITPAVLLHAELLAPIYLFGDCFLRFGLPNV